MIDSLLYVSKSLLQPQAAAKEIEHIVALSQVRNASLDVTGALISTPKFFAQVLEGSPAILDELMASIRRDPRHASVRIVNTLISSRRRFPGYSLAYSGYAAQPDMRIRPLLYGTYGVGEAQCAATVIQLMREFAK